MRFFTFLILQIVLFPLTTLLASIVYLRNWLYDKGILKSTIPDVFTINVGNLNLGGTGKTPHVEYLTNLLATQYHTTILSRGYKRKTQGFILANAGVTAETIGDEPMQYYLKFNDKIKVAVGEDRVAGIKQIQSTLVDNELVILDDAFQHRKIVPHLNLLLCDYKQPFYTDHLVPLGRLRDIRHSASRADAVIVSKCPEYIPPHTVADIQARIGKYVLAGTPVFFSSIHYKPIVSYSNSCVFNAKQPATVVTAIAKPEVFLQHIGAKGYIVNKVFEYADHFAFSRKEIEQFFDKQNRCQQIITTEKDMVKLKPLLTKHELEHFFYIPIEVVISDKATFDDFVLTRAAKVISRNT